MDSGSSPTRRLWVEGALALAPGKLHAGEKELVARQFGGRIDATIEEMDVQRLQGWQVFSRISTRVQLKADVAGVDFLRMFLPERIRMAKGSGPLNIDVKLSRGVIQPPSSVTYTSARVELLAAETSLFGDARIELAVRERERGRLLIAASALGITSSRGTDAGPPIMIRRPRLELETRTLAVQETWKTSGGSLEAPEVVADDLRTLQRLLSDEVRLGGGPVIGRARAQLDERGTIAGQLALRFRDAHVTHDGVFVRATGSFETAIFAPDVPASTGELRGARLEVDRGVVRTVDGSMELDRFHARADLVPYSDFVPERIVASINARFPDARPVLKTLGIEPTGIAAAAAGLFDLSNLEVAARTRFERGNIDVLVERAHTDAVKARGRWRRVDGRERGAFLLMTDLVNVGVEISGGDTTVRPLASESWLERTLAELSLGPVAAPSNRDPIGLRPAPARVVR